MPQAPLAVRSFCGDWQYILQSSHLLLAAIARPLHPLLADAALDLARWAAHEPLARPLLSALVALRAPQTLVPQSRALVARQRSRRLCARPDLARRCDEHYCAGRWWLEVQGGERVG